MFTLRNMTFRSFIKNAKAFSVAHRVKSKKVAMFSAKGYDKKYFKQFKTKELEITYIEAQLNKETAKLAMNHDAICAFVNDDLSAETLEQIQNECDIDKIALRCAGYDKVNTEIAKMLQFRIARVPEYSPNAVAEHTVCLALALNRKMKQALDRVRHGNFELNGLLGFDFFGKTVGVIGTGKIGSRFINIMKGFGTNILCYDAYENPAFKDDPQVKYTDLEEIFSKSDIISLHSNLNSETYHLINEDSIAKMKTGVMILNVSRGSIINTRHVIEGLKNNKIGYLGLDVVEREEEIFFKDLSSGIISNDEIARLMTFNNVIITGHQAFFTHEALTKIAQITIDNLHKLLHELPCENLIV